MGLADCIINQNERKNLLKFKGLIFLFQYLKEYKLYIQICLLKRKISNFTLDIDDEQRWVMTSLALITELKQLYAMVKRDVWIITSNLMAKIKIKI